MKRSLPPRPTRPGPLAGPALPGLALAAFAALLAGCTVGPDYRTPAVPTPGAWSDATPVDTPAPEQPGNPRSPTAAGSTAPGTTTPDTRGPGTVGPSTVGPDHGGKSTAGADAAGTNLVDLAWWEQLGDPLLVDLVERALAANHDLGAAGSRVRRARALRRAAGGAALPTVDGTARAGRSSLSENAPGPLPALAEAGLAELDQELWQVGFDAGWEIDVFGAVRRETEAAGARLDASVERRRAVLLAVVAEVARNYVELRGTQRRLELAEESVRLQAETLRRVADRREVGLASGLDESRAAAQLAGTRATLPDLRVRVRTAVHRLSVLVGQSPAALLEELTPRRPIPVPAAPPTAGLPAELVRRRPDVRAAERSLHAATADVGAAVAQRYPRFRLGGTVGLEAGGAADLLSAGSTAWSLGPGLLAPLFQGGRLRAAVEAAEAGRDEAWVRFEQAVLVALEEVESARVAHAEAEIARQHLADAAHASTDAAERARVLYDTGLGGFLEVLDAERVRTAAEDRLAVQQTAVVLRWVALYKALGGGWGTAEGTAPGPAPPARDATAAPGSRH